MTRPTTERRKRRSALHSQAVDLLLDAVRNEEGLPALSVTTDDGLMIGGAGVKEVDLEWMGAIGASRQRSKLEWEGLTLFVRKVAINGVTLCVTSAGGKASARVDDGLRRILA